MSLFAYGRTQQAIETPFDKTIATSFQSTEVQSALNETREQTVYNSRTQATTLNGTLTLTTTDKTFQILTGTATGYSVVLPDATSLPLTIVFTLLNKSTQSVQIKDGSNANLFVLSQGSIGWAYLRLNGSAAGTWEYFQTVLSVATGIVNYNVISTTAFATGSATDVLITGMALIPQAGTYAIWYSSTNINNQNNSLNNATIYYNGTAIADSKRTFQSGSSNMTFQLLTQTIFQVDGLKTIDLRISTNQGTFTANGRSLLLIRLGV